MNRSPTMPARPPNLGLSLADDAPSAKASEESTADIMAQIAVSIDGLSPGLSNLKLEPLAAGSNGAPLSLTALVRELDAPGEKIEMNPFQNTFSSLLPNTQPVIPMIQTLAAPPQQPVDISSLQLQMPQLPMLVIQDASPLPNFQQAGPITRHMSMPSLTDPFYPQDAGLSASPLNYYACTSPDGFSAASLSDHEYFTDASVDAYTALGLTISQESFDSAAPSTPASRRSSSASRRSSTASQHQLSPTDPNALPAPPRRRRCTLKLSPSEKKARRMEQNRTAAARCRMKKQSRMGSIVTETEALEQENLDLQVSVADLEAQVAQLKEEFLTHHRACHGGASFPHSH